MHVHLRPILSLYWALNLIIRSCSAGDELTGPCQRPVKGLGKVSSTGTVQASLIFVDFPDRSANESIRDALNVAPLSGVADFMRQSSFGKLDIQTTAHTEQYFRMPKYTGEYQYVYPNVTNQTIMSFVSDALAAAGASVSFEGTQLLYIGVARVAMDAINFSTFIPLATEAADGTRIPTSIILGGGYYLSNASAAQGAAITGLSMGIRYQCGTVDPNIGGFSPMCDLAPLAPDFLARQKWTLGWLDEATQVTCLPAADSGMAQLNKTLTLSAVESNTTGPDVKLAAVPLNAYTTLFAEARTQTGVDKDACLSGFGQGGVLLYTAGHSIGPFDADMVSLVNPGLDALPSGCGSDRRGFLALLGLNNLNQHPSYIVPGSTLRVSVLSGTDDHDRFEVRFETGVTSTESLSYAAPTAGTVPTSTVDVSHANPTSGSIEAAAIGMFIVLAAVL